MRQDPAGALARLWPVFFPGLKPSDAKSLKFYQISSTNSSGIITGKQVSLTVPFSTNLNSQVATFFYTGARASVRGIEQRSGETANNFSNNFAFQTSAAYGTIFNYTIGTKTGTADSNTLLNFQFDSVAARGVIVGTNVSVYIANGTGLTNLTSTFSHNGIKALIGGIEQISGRTANNYSSPVLLNIQAFNNSTKQYTISVITGSPSSKEMKSFILNSSSATISGSNIFVSLPIGTNVTNLAASFAHTGKRVLVNGIEQLNGEKENDFTNSIKYTVVASDNSSQDYNVIINFVPNAGIGGTVVGLISGRTLVLQNNTIDNLTINTNGSFVFPAIPNSGSNYNVIVATQPSIQSCSVINGTGTVSNNVIYCLVQSGLQSFTDNGDQTILDNNTGLTWMKCSMSSATGVPLSGATCSGTQGTYQFCNATTNACNGGSPSLPLQPAASWIGGSTSLLWKTCNDANTIPGGGFAGRTNWRVPNKDELISIVDYTLSSSPTINSTFFPRTLFADAYWSSTPYAPDSSNAWLILFGAGDVTSGIKLAVLNVRCVSAP